MPVTHIIGAGLAGLSAAVSLAGKANDVILHEAAAQAGGRCRSFVDTRLGCPIDNGAHLLLSGNRHAMKYLGSIGAADRLIGPPAACFPFVDLRNGRRWTLRPGSGWLPWWILDPGRRVPDTAAADYLSILRIVRAGDGTTVTDCVGEHGPLFERFWEPLTVAVLNTPARNAAALLLRRVLKGTFLKGEAFCRPRIAETSLSATFIDPAVDHLRRNGVETRFANRLCGLPSSDGRAYRLVFSSASIDLGDGDRVILALPPSAAGDLVPGLQVPEASQGIVNVHFHLPAPADLPTAAPFLGLIGGTAQWVFARDRLLSVTIGAANDMIHRKADCMARTAWRDVALALGLDRDTLPAWRVIKERRATISQDPDNLRCRPGTSTRLDNVFLAGDWIDTGLPATIESAILSGERAAFASNAA